MKLQTTNYKLKVYPTMRQATLGFTLVEIMVAVSLFAIVAVITTGALVTASNVNRKAQAIKVAIDNLNFAIDSMVLNLQQGRKFHCVRGFPLSWVSIYDSFMSCSDLDSPGEAIAFNFGPCPDSGSGPDCEQMIYRRYEDPSNNNNGSIQFWHDSGSFVDITAPEINIKDFKVHVIGNNSESAARALLVIKGEVNGSTNTATEFSLENTIYAPF